MNRATRALSAAVLLAAPLVAVAASAPVAHAATSQIRVSLIGDQSVAGLSDAPKSSRAPLTGAYRLNLEATACRQTEGSGDPCFTGKPNTALSIATANAGDMGEVAVIATGYNDSQTLFPGWVDGLMTELTTHGVQKVIWLNLRLTSTSNPPTGTQLTKWSSFNTTLTSKAATTWNGKLFVADWNTASAGQDSWFHTGGTDPVVSQIEIRSNEPGPSNLATFIKGRIDAIAGSVVPTPPPTNPGPARCAAANGVGVPSSGPGAVAPQADITPALYKAIPPERVLDTRAGAGALNTTNRMIGAGRLYRLNVTDGYGSDVPTYANAASLNVTAVTPCTGGFATVFPCSAPSDTTPVPLVHTPPNASSLNFLPGQVVPNAVITKLGEFGRVCFYTSAQTDLLVDATGFYSANAAAVLSAHQAVTPHRVFDTRPGAPADVNLGHKIAGLTRQMVKVSPSGTVPAGMAGVALNVGVTGPTGAGFLSVTPGKCPSNGSPAPTSSNLNFVAGQTIANQVQVQVPTGGGASNGNICVYTSATTDVFIDAFGAFLPPATPGDGILTQTPVRLLDTRSGTAAKSPDKTPIAAGGTKTLNVATLGSLPVGAHAAVMNVTVIGPNAPGYVSVFPCGTGNASVSNINYAKGDVRPNLVDVPLGTGGNVCMFSSAQTNVLVDLIGWYQT